METQALPSDLAGVLAFLPHAGAHHAVRDVARVGVLTLLVIDDGDVGTSQGVGQAHCGNGRKGCGTQEPPGSLPRTAGLALNPVPGLTDSQKQLLCCSNPAWWVGVGGLV